MLHMRNIYKLIEFLYSGDMQNCNNCPEHWSLIYKEKACITMFIDWLNTCTTFPTNQKEDQNPSGLAYAFSLFFGYIYMFLH